MKNIEKKKYRKTGNIENVNIEDNNLEYKIMIAAT
jgi:hypothetical protein